MSDRKRIGMLSGLSKTLENAFSKKALNSGMSRLSDYPSSEKLFEESAVFRFFQGRSVSKKMLKFKNRFAYLCENSVLLNFLYGFPSKYVTSCIKNTAAFLLSYSLSAVSTLFVQSYLTDTPLDSFQLSAAVIFVMFALPLLISDSSVYRLLCGGTFLKSLLFDTFFMPKNEYAEKANPGKFSLLTVAAGLLLGLCVRHVSILAVPVCILLLLILSIILISPESGLALLVFCAPFLSFSSYSSLILASFVCFVMLSFIFKLLRGRRIQRFSVETLVFLLLTFGVLLSSVPVGTASAKAALISAVMMLGYYLSVNLFRNEDKLMGVVRIISLSAAVVSSYGIIQYILGEAPLGWLDFSLFPEISGRSVSFFENPNMLGAYLALSFPFSLELMSGTDRSCRFAGTLSSVLSVICAVLTWSRGCWLGMFIGFVLYFVFLTPRSVVLLPVSAVSITAAAFIFPDTLGQRLLSFFSMSDSANRYRVRVWQGSFKALSDCWYSGAGAGDMAFRSVYLNYSLTSAEKAVHSHSIFLQLGLGCGIITLALFCIFILLLLRKTLCCSGTQVKCTTARIAFAAFSSVCSACISGIFDNVFYNYRVMFLFYCVCGICSVASKLAIDHLVTRDSASPEAVDVTISF